MKESIHIQNFGPLRDVRIDDIKPLTVLIGDSASGKSTLMKVITLMRSIYRLANIYSYLKNSGITVSPLLLSLEKLLSDGLKQMLSSETEIMYYVRGGKWRYSVESQKKSLGYFLSIDKADLVFFEESFVAETRSLVPEWYTRGSNIRGDLGHFFHETYNDFFKAMDQITEQPLDYIGMKMFAKQVGLKKELFVEPNDRHHKAMELHDTSSGIQASAPLMTIVRYFAREYSFTNAFRRSVLNYLTDEDISQFRPEVGLQDLKKYIHLYIEEPELSLDPKTQCLFINDLIREAFYRGDNKRPDDGRQLGLMFATHSPYILNHLNVLLKASYYEKASERYPYINPDEIAVYRMDDGEVEPLMAIDNKTEHHVINTIDLSETMEDIFDDYVSINE